MNETDIEFTSVDGFKLGGTILMPTKDPIAAAVFVHGGGVNRSEWCGFYDKLAMRLAASQIASLRFDHHAYLASKDSKVNLTIASVATDIDVAIDAFGQEIGLPPLHIVGSSFGAGASVMWANNRPLRAQSLTLLYPLLDYRQRVLETKSWWNGTSVSDEIAQRLADGETVQHVARVPISNALIHEAALFSPEHSLRNLDLPVLIVHGTADARIPYDTSAALHRSGAASELMTLDGADHGFAFPGDVQHTDSRTLSFQAMAFDRVADWIQKLS